jgi:hypothetical protein
MFEGHPRFETAAGSVPGRTHALAGRPNQDAFVLHADPAAVVAVVADGCGGAEHSEVGAWIGAHALAAEVGRASGGELDDPCFWEAMEASVLATLRATAAAMGGDLRDVVHRFFLFTVVGAVVAGDRAAVFSLGDGLLAVNGEVLRLGPFPGNAPPYLGHALLGEAHIPGRRLVVHRTFPAREVESILVATDGAAEWDGVENRPLPGTRELTGPFAQLWKEDRYFEHPDALRRKLHRMNRPFVRPVWESRRLDKEPGLLEDDTTIVVIRALRCAARAAA